MTATKHRHHIVPRHMGGSDDPSNIVELTQEEHAQAHLELYEKYGKPEDAWAARILGSEPRTDFTSGMKGKKHSEETKERMSLSHQGEKHWNYGGGFPKAREIAKLGWTNHRNKLISARYKHCSHCGQIVYTPNHKEYLV